MAGVMTVCAMAEPNGTMPMDVGPDFLPAGSVASTVTGSPAAAGRRREKLPSAATLWPEIDAPLRVFFTSTVSGVTPVTERAAPATVAVVALTGVMVTSDGETIGAVARFWMTTIPC